MKQLYTLIITLIICNPTFSQDTTGKEATRLREININRIKKQRDIKRLDTIVGTFIFSGKKNEVIDLTHKDIALTEKYGRQVFSKIPGAFIYDMDGTGNQTNISTRGLDPHRGWEFNIRKDGVITNSDMYGYPASHYSVPLEAVERIELVRGTSSLQYGGQFGGMLNYVSKKPDSAVLAFQSINTVGSNGLLSTFNSISGTKRKFSYYAWFNKKVNNGYRVNSDSKYDGQNISLFYEFNPDLLLKVEWTRSNYVIHLAGQLTDQMFADNPRSSTRSRNYYSPEINVPSINLDWKAGKRTRLKFTSSAVIGSRNSVLFDKLANIVDAIDPVTLQYTNRQVDIDHFNSYTTELRLLQSYHLLGHTSNLAAGIQYMNNDLHRQQLGKGTIGTDFDLSLVTPGFGRDMHLKTNNVAFFVENRWVLLPKLSLNTGVRAELGETDMTGLINNYPEEDIPNTIKHKYPLFGANMQYELNKTMNIYAGWSQAYRPVIFKDIIPGSTFELVDKSLKDARGYNLEGGFRGNWAFLNWDVSYFQLQYNNRLGTVSQTNAAAQETIYRTNIGDAKTKGVELFLQAEFPLGNIASLSLFTATAYMDARYQHAAVRDATLKTTVQVSGNKVESVPEWQTRNGATLKLKNSSLSILHNFTAKSFADALNTVQPNATGTVGVVPAYTLFDVNASVGLSKQLHVRLNMNNVFDKDYFTKRPQFYPGPGIWPSDGRTYSATVAISL
jgi:Fe(3+) dicitrate transport protein